MPSKLMLSFKKLFQQEDVPEVNVTKQKNGREFHPLMELNVELTNSFALPPEDVSNIVILQIDKKAHKGSIIQRE